jgi:hypothetical protein
MSAAQTTTKPRVRVRFEQLPVEDARRACATTWPLGEPRHDHTEHDGGALDRWRHFVYEAYDVSGMPLYIGRSMNLAQRLRVHQRTQPWWPEVASLLVSALPCMSQSVIYEERRIRVAQPRCNRRIGRYTRRRAWGQASSA